MKGGKKRREGRQKREKEGRKERRKEKRETERKKGKMKEGKREGREKERKRERKRERKKERKKERLLLKFLSIFSILPIHIHTYVIKIISAGVRSIRWIQNELRVLLGRRRSEWQMVSRGGGNDPLTHRTGSTNASASGASVKTARTRWRGYGRCEGGEIVSTMALWWKIRKHRQNSHPIIH